MVEHLGHGAAQRLGAVEHDQQRAGDVQPAVAQPNQHLGDQGGVRGGALGQSEGTLVPSRVIPRATTQQCSATRIPSPAAPPAPASTAQRPAVRPGRARSGPRTDATPPTWRSPSWPGRPGCRPVPARPGRGGSTAWPASAPPPAAPAGRWRRTPDRSAPAAHRCRRRSGPAVGAPAPGGRPRSPGPARCHDGPRSAPGGGGPWRRPAGRHPRPPWPAAPPGRPHRQGQPSLTGGAGQFGHGHGHPLGQVIQGLVGGGSALGILRHGGPLLVELLGRCPTPTTRQASGGDRHLNLYETRDNLSQRPRPARPPGVRPGVREQSGCRPARCLPPATPKPRSPASSDANLAAIDQALRQGARAHGFDTDNWALARITSVVGPASRENCEPRGLVTERRPRTVPVPTGA
jgi:hypothetical protein